MYSLFISAGISLSIAFGMIFIPERGFYFLGPFLGLIGFVGTFMLLSRVISNKVQPLFAQAQKQVMAGNATKAIETFQGALVHKNWQLGLEKQINTQVGILLYSTGKDKEAVDYLVKGYPKNPEGHLILGSLLYRGGKVEAAREALESGIRFNKKSPMLYNLLAWFHFKEGERETAIEVLNRSIKAAGEDEETSQNLKRLQNNKKMNMKPFGQLWFMLKFETPRGMQQAPQFRKGFRQPPKRKKSKKR